MTPERLELEKQVLASKLPGNIYRFMDMDKPEPYLVMAAKTNRDNIYTIKIMLSINLVRVSISAKYLMS